VRLLLGTLEVAPRYTAGGNLPQAVSQQESPCIALSSPHHPFRHPLHEAAAPKVVVSVEIEPSRVGDFFKASRGLHDECQAVAMRVKIGMLDVSRTVVKSRVLHLETAPVAQCHDLLTPWCHDVFVALACWLTVCCHGRGPADTHLLISVGTLWRIVPERFGKPPCSM